MGTATHNRRITEADLQAKDRLRALWDSKAKKLGVTQETVAELLDGSQGLVSQYLNGKLALNYKAVLAFSSALQLDDPRAIRSDLPEQQLAPARGVSESPASYDEWRDIRGYAQGVGLGAGAEAEEYAETHKLKFRAESLRRKGLFPRNLAVYYGHGDSMEPRIKTGDAILFDTSDTKPVDGQIYIVQLGREIHAKRCEILDDIVFFRADNPTGDHNWRKAKRMDNARHPITIIGRVRWIGSWEQ